MQVVGRWLDPEHHRLRDFLTRGHRMSAYLVERIQQHPRIDVRLETQLTALHASGDRLTGVTATDAAGSARTDPADAVFICIGGVPTPTGPRPRSPWETSRPGLFAAGDVRHGSIKRVAGAVGEGAMAALLAQHRLEEIVASG